MICTSVNCLRFIFRSPLYNIPILLENSHSGWLRLIRQGQGDKSSIGWRVKAERGLRQGKSEKDESNVYSTHLDIFNIPGKALVRSISPPSPIFHEREGFGLTLRLTR